MELTGSCRDIPCYAAAARGFPRVVNDAVTRLHGESLAVSAYSALTGKDKEEFPLCGVRMIEATRLARREHFERDVKRVAAVRRSRVLLGAERERYLTIASAECPLR
jgi:hypothetical protein